MNDSSEIDREEEKLQRMFTQQSDQIDSLIEQEKKNIKDPRAKAKEKRQQQKKSRQKNRRK
jgi:hypothetical protein